MPLPVVQNRRFREEVLALSGRNLQLSGENAELSSRLRGDQEALRLLRERLEKVTKEHQEESAKVSFVSPLLIGLFRNNDVIEQQGLRTNWNQLMS